VQCNLLVFVAKSVSYDITHTVSSHKTEAQISMQEQITVHRNLLLDTN